MLVLIFLIIDLNKYELVEELVRKINTTFNRDNPYYVSKFEPEIDELDNLKEFIILLMKENRGISFEYLYAVFLKYFKTLSFEDWIYILKALINSPYPTSLDGFLKSAYIFLEIDFYTELEKMEDLDEEWKEMWLKSILNYPVLSKSIYPKFFGKIMDFEPNFFSEITNKLVSEGAIKAEEIIIHSNPKKKKYEYLTPFPPTTWFWAKKYKSK